MISRASLLLVSIFILLAGIFGALYFNDHAWGAWGDDSAGYIFLAGRMSMGLPLVYTDPIATMGLQFFGDEKLARWLMPTHHEFINPSGTIASKYPIGVSLLMWAAAKIAGTTDAFYIITPLAATLNVLLTYGIGIFFFRKQKFHYLFAAVAAVMLGLADLYYHHAIAQPMREIPSMTFLLLSTFILLIAQGKQRAVRIILLIVAGASFGMAFNIRETSLIISPAMLILLWPTTATTKRLRSLLQHVTLFGVGFLLAILPSIVNAMNISEEKVPFKARDMSSITLVPNINHVSSFSVRNLFDNQGKFLPGRGSLVQYWDVMNDATPLPWFLLAVAIGIVVMFQRERRLTLALVAWFIGILGIFSLWVNPYARYILPLFPPLILFGVAGIAAVMQLVLPVLFPRRWMAFPFKAMIVVTIVLLYIPIVQDAVANMRTDVYQFKAISRQDLQTLQDIGQVVTTSTDKPLVVFSGNWQYGISETFEAHTGIKAVRFPLEQRFAFQAADVKQFFDKLIADGYDLVVWSDHTSSVELYQWMRTYETVQLLERDFSFEPNVTLTIVR